MNARLLARASFALILVALLACAVASVRIEIDRAAAGFINPGWSEGPLLLELHRMEVGEPAYTPPAAANAYDYGPVYVGALHALCTVMGLHGSLLTFRLLTVLLGLLCAVPLGYASVAVVRRAGLGGRGPAVASATVGAVLGVAILSRNVTFEKVHPDNLAFFLVATAVSLHFGIAARLLSTRFFWGIVLFGAAATFTKQNTVAVAPLLLLGLALARALSWRAFAAGAGAFVLVVAACIAAMPPDMRAWTLWVPLAHHYEFTASRLAGALSALTSAQPYLGLTILASAATVVTLRARTGARSLWIDGAAVAAVATAALSAYFKQLGIENDLTMLAAASVAYSGACIGELYAAARADRRAAFGALALGAALTLSLQRHLNDPRPALTPAAERDSARLQRFADAVCAGGRTVLLDAPFAEFFRCRSVSFALPSSLTELQLAYPRYDPGTTVFQARPRADYIVGPPAAALPAAWSPYYHAVALVATEAALGGEPPHVSVYARDAPPPRNPLK